MRHILITLFFSVIFSGGLMAQTTTMPPVMDPVMIQEKDTYYLFGTDIGGMVYSSKDMKNWKKEAPVFATLPEWVNQVFPNFNGLVWAPDIIFHNGEYHLFYSITILGTNNSYIGHAVNKTLNPESTDFGWKDRGYVLQSVPFRDMWNAIDPNIIVDANGTPWMTFGSFWEGIKLVKMKQDLSAIAEPQEWHALAKRTRNPMTMDDQPGQAAVEAPFIMHHDDYYYLFVSYDSSPIFEHSDYKVMVGRAEHIEGPYFNREGVSMNAGTATCVVEGNATYPGVGHCAAYTFDTKDYLVFWGGNVEKKCCEALIRPITWDEEGWPVVSL